jgi:hypothetical protein
MKKMIALVFFFSLFFGAEGTAQQPGDSKPLAGHNSIKARRELRKEHRVYKREVKNKKTHHVVRSKESLVGERKVLRHKKRKNKEKNGTATAIVKSDQ